MLGGEEGRGGEESTKQGECGKPHSGDSLSLSNGTLTQPCAAWMGICIPIREAHKQAGCKSCTGTRTMMDLKLEGIISRGGRCFGHNEVTHALTRAVNSKPSCVVNILSLSSKRGLKTP